jgi:hypothetical protein
VYRIEDTTVLVHIARADTYVGKFIVGSANKLLNGKVCHTLQA